uniref:Secreted protein n=1 Tax=Meloidogyne javanica TaxID=6303 RepID=A0A915MWJ9_MELJA
MQLFNSLYHNSNKVFNMSIMLSLLFVVVSTFSLNSLEGNQTDFNIGANGVSNHSDSTYYTTMPTTTSTITVKTTAPDTPRKLG